MELNQGVPQLLAGGALRRVGGKCEKQLTATVAKA